MKKIITILLILKASSINASVPFQQNTHDHIYFVTNELKDGDLNDKFNCGIKIKSIVETEENLTEYLVIQYYKGSDTLKEFICFRNLELCANAMAFSLSISHDNYFIKNIGDIYFRFIEKRITLNWNDCFFNLHIVSDKDTVYMWEDTWFPRISRYKVQGHDYDFDVEKNKKGELKIVENQSEDSIVTTYPDVKERIQEFLIDKIKGKFRVHLYISEVVWEISKGVYENGVLIECHKRPTVEEITK